jgi:hypothetical protein
MRSFWHWLTMSRPTPPLACLWCSRKIPTTPQVQVVACAQQCRVGPYGWWHARGQDVAETENQTQGRTHGDSHTDAG